MTTIILQVGLLKNLSKDKPRYRRYIINEYLKTKYEVYTINEKNIIELFKYKNSIVYISKPIIPVSLLEQLKSKGIPIIYDRTDNWECCPLDNPNTYYDIETIKLSDIVINSSEFLYESSKKFTDKCLYISNGAFYHEKMLTEKHLKQTIVYIGSNGNKLDWNLLNNIAYKYSDFNVNLFGISKNIPKKLEKNVNLLPFIENEYELFKELCKCHIGIIPFIKSEFTKGMFPLKLIQYFMADLPVIYTNCESAKTFNECIEYSDSIDLYNVSKMQFNYSEYKQKYSWSSILDKIDNVIKEFI